MAEEEQGKEKAGRLEENADATDFQSVLGRDVVKIRAALDPRANQLVGLGTTPLEAAQDSEMALVHHQP